MADRLTQLQDAVNSVSNCTRLISVVFFPEGKQGRKRQQARQRAKLGSGEWTEAGLQHQALGLEGGGAAVWKVLGRRRGGSGASGLLACEVEDLTPLRDRTAWTVTLHGLIMFSRKGFIWLSVVLMGVLLFGREGRGSGSFFPLINFNPRRAILVLNDWIFAIRC